MYLIKFWISPQQQQTVNLENSNTPEMNIFGQNSFHWYIDIIVFRLICNLLAPIETGKTIWNNKKKDASMA